MSQSSKVSWARLSGDLRHTSGQYGDQTTGTFILDPSGEEVRCWFTIGSVLDRMQDGDLCLLEYSKGKWRLKLDRQVPEHLKLWESRPEPDLDWFGERKSVPPSPFTPPMPGGSPFVPPAPPAPPAPSPVAVVVGNDREAAIVPRLSDGLSEDVGEYLQIWAELAGALPIAPVDLRAAATTIFLERKRERGANVQRTHERAMQAERLNSERAMQADKLSHDAELFWEKAKLDLNGAAAIVVNGGGLNGSALPPDPVPAAPKRGGRRKKAEPPMVDPY